MLNEEQVCEYLADNSCDPELQALTEHSCFVCHAHVDYTYNQLGNHCESCRHIFCDSHLASVPDPNDPNKSARQLCEKCHNQIPISRRNFNEHDTFLKSEKDQPKFMSLDKFKDLCKRIYKRRNLKSFHKFEYNFDKPNFSIWETLAGSSGAAESCKALGWQTPSVVIERNTKCWPTLDHHCNVPTKFRFLQTTKDTGNGDATLLPSQYARLMGHRPPGKNSKRKRHHKPYHIDVAFFWGCCTPYTICSNTQLGFKQGAGRCHVEELLFIEDSLINLIVKEQCVEWTYLQNGEPFRIYLELQQALHRQIAFRYVNTKNGLTATNRNRVFLLSTAFKGIHPSFLFEIAFQLSPCFVEQQKSLYQQKQQKGDVPKFTDIVSFQLQQKERMSTPQTEIVSAITTAPRRSAIGLLWHNQYGQQHVTAGPINPKDSTRLMGFEPGHFEHADTNHQYSMIGDACHSQIIQQITKQYDDELERLKSGNESVLDLYPTALSLTRDQPNRTLEEFIAELTSNPTKYSGGFSAIVNNQYKWILVPNHNDQSGPSHFIPNETLLGQYILNWPLPSHEGKRLLNNGDYTYLSKAEAAYMVNHQAASLSHITWLWNHLESAAHDASTHYGGVGAILPTDPSELENVSEWITAMLEADASSRANSSNNNQRKQVKSNQT